MGTTLGTTFRAPTLVRVPSKGDKWYVYVTKPESLQTSSSKQERRSTGTTDEKVAKERAHDIVKEIYAEFERKLGGVDTFETRLAKLYEAHVGHQLPKAVMDELDQTSLVFLLQAKGITIPDSLVEKMDPCFRQEVRALGEEPAEPALVNVAEKIKKHDSKTKVSDILPVYLEGRVWNRNGTKMEAERYIRRFVELVEDADVTAIKIKSAYDYAQALHDEELANKTVTTAVSYVKAMLTWCVERGIVEQHGWDRPINLRNYGYKSRKYRPLRPDQLNDLFQLEMPQQDRLILAILITTGMRLDEAALLTWDQVKLNDTVPHFDLTEAIVKTGGSQRFVPIPDALLTMLPEVGQGRLFTYPLDKDGKAQKKASERLGKHIHKVRDNERQVTHSLRGTLKDLLRDAGVSKEINHFITGHDQGDQGGNYGDGPSLAVRSEALNRIDHPWLSSGPKSQMLPSVGGRSL